VAAILRYADQLVEQARSLAEQDPTRPAQASLRRAVSAAYYALFHFLIGEASKELLPREAKALRSVVSRTFVHAEMAEASKAFSKAHAKGVLELHESLRASLRRAPVHACVASMSSAFADAQQARSKADYDLSRRVRKHEALAYVQQAEDEISSWRSSGTHPSKPAYLVSLLLWRKMKRD
jgi:hypothetical protein